MCLCGIRWKFSMLSILQLLNAFSEKCKPFSKIWSTVFLVKVLRLKMRHFHKKLLCQKPKLRQMECGVQNGPIKNKSWLNPLPHAPSCLAYRCALRDLIT